ncbi:dTDP-D-glucose 4,6-dehydratase-like isoform X2 [Synchiropus splendidus]|uniref:dTDP-D-glucose 4,6-dehydratase-like isoform X2 n=1 Tax=Synchiropus splendidus TaxID=270530 RepID=UPI00237E6F27|nr:dTDP-D-glucose 4,6-dehydratase-like isoform X2 [Synchiropus splendidus]
MDYRRTVLVTGGSGFIGSHLVCRLVNAQPEWKIINLDNLDYCCSPRSLESVQHRDNYTFIRGDVCNAKLVKRIFSSNRINVVFHLAAKTHVESSFMSPSSFRQVNIDGTRVMLAAALLAPHQPERFIYVSTDEVYGQGLDQEFDENSPVQPSNPYSTTKAAAEFLVRSYWDKYKFPVIITRSNNVYGPRQYTEKVIPRFLTLLEMNKKCTIQGTLPKSRHFLFVDDAVRAFLLLLDKGAVGEVYNIGSVDEIPIVQLARDLVKMVTSCFYIIWLWRACGHVTLLNIHQVKNVPDSELNDWLEFVPDRPQVELRYPIKSEKLQQLGWRSEVTWTEGLTRTVKWYQENPDFWPCPIDVETSEDKLGNASV